MAGTTGQIVAGVDGSGTSRAALRWAMRQARLTGARVDAVMAWEYPSVYAPAAGCDADVGAETTRAIADTVAQEGGGGPDAMVQPVAGEGLPAEVLLEAARDADLLVVGSRGHGKLASAVIGSVSLHCVLHARCPVVVLREEPGAGDVTAGATRRIVAGVDGSGPSRAALAWAIRQARRTGAAVDAVMAWSYEATWESAATCAGDIKDEYARTLASIIKEAGSPEEGVLIRPVVADGHAVTALLDAARDADLLVVGSRGHGGFASALIGSVSLQCVLHARCPVLVLHDGHESASGPPGDQVASKQAEATGGNLR